jgi:hypothetical protein
VSNSAYEGFLKSLLKQFGCDFLKRIIFIGLTGVILVTGFGFYLSKPISILTLSDFIQELDDSNESVISSVVDDPNPWKSFNHW